MSSLSDRTSSLISFLVGGVCTSLLYHLLTKKTTSSHANSANESAKSSTSSPSSSSSTTSHSSIISSSSASYDSFSLSGKVAIVTGSSSGIGLATSRLLALRGAMVFMVARRKDLLEKEADAIQQLVHKQQTCTTTSTTVHQWQQQQQQSPLPTVFPIVGDVTHPAVCHEIISQVLTVQTRQDSTRTPHIDILFNNAGIYEGDCQLHEHTYDMFQQVLQTNVNGVFHMMKAVIQQMIKQRQTSQSPPQTYSIINNSSVDGLRPTPGSAAYCTSKHAVVGLTRVAAREYAESGIRINCVCPGWIETDMTSTTPIDMMLSQTPLSDFTHKIGSPDEIAQTVAFLASSAASFITGTEIVVDGGYMTT